MQLCMCVCVCLCACACVCVLTFACSNHLSVCSWQTLVKDLEGDTHGHFERLLVALATPPAVYDAQEVMRAIDVRAQVSLFVCFS